MKPITGKSGLEGDWTEEIISDRYSFLSFGTSSFYSRGLNSHLSNLHGGELSFKEGGKILTGGYGPDPPWPRACPVLSRKAELFSPYF